MGYGDAQDKARINSRWNIAPLDIMKNATLRIQLAHTARHLATTSLSNVDFVMD
jgi:hypothetical protein